MSTAADYIAPFTHEHTPRLDQAALVLIDLQPATGARHGALGRKLAAEGSSIGEARFHRIETLLLPNAQKLLTLFRRSSRPVLHVTNGALRRDALDAAPHMRKLFTEFAIWVGSPEQTILPEVAPEQGEPVLRKTTIGAFASTGIDSLLRALGCGQLYMAGISTNMCVESTAREAADRGYAVTLVEDACATTHADLHDATLRNFQRLFGRVRSTLAVLDELGVH